MSNLSKRELFMLFVISMIVLVGASVLFLINPLRGNIQENRNRLRQVESMKRQVDQELASLPNLRNQKGVKLTKVEEKIESLADPLHPAEFERWILPVFINHRVTVTNANLSQTTVATPELMLQEATPQVYRLLELIQDFNRLSTSFIPLPTSTTQLLFAEHTYRIQVSFTNFMDMINAINAWDTSIFISSATYDFENESGNLSLRIYSTHKLTPGEVLSIYLGDLGFHPDEIIGPKESSDSK